ncbi:hypothetical protein EYC58_02730 [Candidatus Saccharibacteria bacterium]|nr:MAG: hypothetical protein EYC58_02730 [Candidatus Saccharibacteria bacterium]
MKKVLIGIAIAIAVIAVCIIGYSVLGANTDNVKDKQTLFLLEATLNKTKDKYAQCYNSVNYGKLLVGQVAMSYSTYETTTTEQAKLDGIEESFLAEVAGKCDGAIKEYESKYQEYKSLSEKIGETSSWLSLLIGGSESQPVGMRVTEYEPSMVRFNSSQFSNYVFSEQDVKKYFDGELRKQ